MPVFLANQSWLVPLVMLLLSVIDESIRSCFIDRSGRTSYLLLSNKTIVAQWDSNTCIQLTLALGERERRRKLIVMDHGLGPTRVSNAGSVNTKPLSKRVSLFWECNKGVMAEEQGFSPKNT